MRWTRILTSLTPGYLGNMSEYTFQKRFNHGPLNVVNLCLSWNLPEIINEINLIGALLDSQFAFTSHVYDFWLCLQVAYEIALLIFIVRGVV